jgi:hypothetical protein
VASLGSTGDSYDNALTEAFNSLFKAELIRNKGTWRSIDDLGIAAAECIDWLTTVAPSRRDRHNPARRGRDRALPSPPRAGSSRRVSSKPPLNPARNTAATVR